MSGHSVSYYGKLAHWVSLFCLICFGFEFNLMSLCLWEDRIEYRLEVEKSRNTITRMKHIVFFELNNSSISLSSAYSSCDSLTQVVFRIRLLATMNFWLIWVRANVCNDRKIVRSTYTSWWNTVGRRIRKIDRTFRILYPNWSRHINAFTSISTIWDRIMCFHQPPKICWLKWKRMIRIPTGYSSNSMKWKSNDIRLLFAAMQSIDFQLWYFQCREKAKIQGKCENDAQSRRSCKTKQCLSLSSSNAHRSLFDFHKIEAKFYHLDLHDSIAYVRDFTILPFYSLVSRLKVGV